MANTIDELIVQIKADTKQLRKELNKVHKQLDKTKKKTKGANDAFGKMKKALIAIGATQILGKVVEINRTFEDLEATLRAVTGSAEAAEKSFELIRAFTSSTTFQIEEVARAFITLKQAGIVPTSDALMDFGNFAAGMGKSITQLAQAAFNATTGEMEMLKQFGVIARQQGDQITVTFDGTTKTIERSGDAIVDYLRSIGREKFPTAIEERFNTLSGAISNLNDQVSEFAVSMGDGKGGIGMRQSFIDLAKATGSLIETLRPLGEIIGSLIGALTNCVTAVVELADSLLIVFRALTDVTSIVAVFNGFMDGTITDFDSFKKAVRGGVGDLDELDKSISELLKTGGDFRAFLSSDEQKDYKLFLELRKQVEKTRSSVTDLIDKDFARLKKIVSKTVESQLRLDIASAIEADDPTIGRTVEKFGEKFFQINEGEVEKRRKAFVFALLGVESIDEFMKEITENTDLVSVEDIINFEPSEKFADFKSTLTSLFEDTKTPLDKINEQLASINEIFESPDKQKLLEFYGLTEDELNDVTKNLESLKIEMGKTEEVTDAMAEVLERASDQFANDFINALQNGENAIVSFRNLVGDMIQQVIAEFLKMNIIKPMMNTLFAAVGLPTIPTGKAGGGTIQGGTPTLVGERGAEIFVPNTGGTIMNNMNSKNAMGGGGTTVINQSINFATGIVPTVRAEVMQMMPQIADVTKAAVQESAMRGGNFRRSLLGG